MIGRCSRQPRGGYFFAARLLGKGELVCGSRLGREQRWEGLGTSALVHAEVRGQVGKVVLYRFATHKVFWKLAGSVSVRKKTDVGAKKTEKNSQKFMRAFCMVFIGISYA